MLIVLDAQQTPVVLGAMRAVATAGGQALSNADRVALTAFVRYVLQTEPASDIDTLPAVAPATLAAALPDADARTHVVQFLIVMALVDGTIDGAKIDAVLRYASALDVHEDAVRQLAETGRGNLAWVRADVARQNLRSITGHAVTQSIDQWILPYRDAHEDPALAARYRALGDLPEGTLGRAFFEFYRSNRFAFAGEPTGLNAAFASPHDSAHVLSGYDTSPQGELLVSTFTAGMHPRQPMSGHILPVILSWHVGIKLADTPGSFTGHLDPRKFWVAWQRGSEVKVDVFGAGWSLWDAAPEPLAALRGRYGIPPLDPQDAAGGEVPATYRPSA